MCHDYAQCCPYGGISSERDVEKPQRDDSCGSGRHGFPYSDCGEGHRTLCTQLGKTDYTGQTCLWGCVQEYGT